MLTPHYYDNYEFICAKEIWYGLIFLCFSGGVLCSFSVGLEESERPRRGHAISHCSLNVQGELLSASQITLRGSMKPWRSKIKCEVSPNSNYGDYDIEIVKFTTIQPEWNQKDLNTFCSFHNNGFINILLYVRWHQSKLLQVAAAEANVPEAPPVDAAPALAAQAPLILLALLWLQVRTALSPNPLWSDHYQSHQTPTSEKTQAVKNLQRKVGFSALRKIYI